MTAPSRETVAETVRIPCGAATLTGTFARPSAADSVILFAHGSGSSRRSPRNKAVAAELQRAGFATLLLDLLTAGEDRIDAMTREHRFDIPLLGSRLVMAIDWLSANGWDRPADIGLFGASTGAGAALIAAAQRPRLVGATVSRGGRPDLAGPALPRVTAPTLLIVGGDDEPVIALNRQAMAAMTSCPVRLAIIRGATHLFEEPGTLEQVTALARDWFLAHLSRRAPSAH
ncbi:MAG: dienelactone hydrolase family protein [Chloroflexota bacterium]